jgi:hypothetical protein
MATRTATESPPGYSRASRFVAAQRLRAPATIANTSRNAGAETDRHARWAPARDALWQLLQPLLSPDGRVAVLGAGNGDDLPLDRIAHGARHVSLLDLDVPAARGARRRQPRRLRRHIQVIEHDVTNGAADKIAVATARGEVPAAPVIPESPLPGAPYDLVIGDLLYSQLLYPALVDLDIPTARTTAVLARYSPMLTRSVVARLHVSAPHGDVVHIHDPIAWWPGHSQPVALSQILAIADLNPEAAARLAARGTGPRDSDPRAALAAFAIPTHATAMWRWPFAKDVDYLACATHTRADSLL